MQQQPECSCNDIRKRLLRDGFLVLEKFFSGQELQALQLEAELVLESAGAYDSDDWDGNGDRACEGLGDVARTRGCIFEVTRPLEAAAGCRPHATSAAAVATAAPLGCTAIKPAAVMTDSDAATNAASNAAAATLAMSTPGRPGLAPVSLPGPGLLASPQLHRLIASALGAPPSCGCCGGGGSGRGGNGRCATAGCRHDNSGAGAAGCRDASGSRALELAAAADAGKEPAGQGPDSRACGVASGEEEGAVAPAATQANGPSGGADGDRGGGPYLFNEQFIVKPPRSGGRAAFAWHRDSDWCRGRLEYDYAPYISVWTALDDMTAVNGALAVVRGSHRGIAEGAAADGAEEEEGQGEDASEEGPDTDQEEEGGGGGGGGHVQGRPQRGKRPRREQRQREQRERLGYAEQLLVPAGTVVVFLDTLVHASGPNTSRHSRRAWMPQFSDRPITRRDDGTPVALAVPLAAIRRGAYCGGGAAAIAAARPS